jgi:hypothetical protein
MTSFSTSLSSIASWPNSIFRYFSVCVFRSTKITKKGVSGDQIFSSYEGRGMRINLIFWCCYSTVLYQDGSSCLCYLRTLKKRTCPIKCLRFNMIFIKYYWPQNILIYHIYPTQSILISSQEITFNQFK